MSTITLMTCYCYNCFNNCHINFILGAVKAGVIDWCRPHIRADGISVTLYERKIQSAEHYGDPIADAYAVVARPNSCILALADGVNWGQRPKLAARAAVLGSIEHLHSKLFQCLTAPKTTQDIFHHILLSFDVAQKEIIAHEGTTTTLTVAIVCEILPHPRVSSRWALCVVSVGDSPCFLYKPNLEKVYEVTAAAHMGKGRDPRDAGGCLGANCGDNPDLSNLVCCFLPVSENDMILITSDGVSDNFDLVSLRKAVPENPHISSNPSSLPTVTPEVRQMSMVEEIGNLLTRRSHYLNRMLSVQDVLDTLISYCVDATDEKRRFLEHVWQETSDPSLSPRTRREKERALSQQSKTLPGKLDHTTAAGFQVGELRAVPGIVELSRSTTTGVSNYSISSPSRVRWSSQHPSSLRRVASVNDTNIYKSRT